MSDRKLPGIDFKVFGLVYLIVVLAAFTVFGVLRWFVQFNYFLVIGIILLAAIPVSFVIYFLLLNKEKRNPVSKLHTDLLKSSSKCLTRE